MTKDGASQDPSTWRRHGSGAGHRGIGRALSGPLRNLLEAPLGERLSSAALALLVADAFLCPFALGGAPLWAAGGAACLGFAALLFAAASRGAAPSGEARGGSVRLPHGAWCWLLATALVAFQLVPLPSELIRLLAPATHDALADHLGGPGLFPAFRPLTLDAPGTCRCLLTLLAAAFPFAAASILCEERDFRRPLAKALALSALAIALTGFGHWLSGSRLLFGAFAFQEAAPPFLTPFGNPNHLGAFLIVGGLFAATLALTASDATRRLFWWMAWVVVAIALCLSLSRGPLAAFALGHAALALAHGRLRKAQGGTPVPRGTAAALAVALFTVAFFACHIAFRRISAEWAPLAESGLSGTKLSLAALAWPLLRDHWSTGVGMGAFEPAFQRFLDQPGQGLSTFTHPENILVEWTAGLGIPLGLLVLAAFAHAAFQSARRLGKDLLHWCALVAVLAVTLNEFFNFSLSFVGTAVPFAIAFALAGAHRHGGRLVPAKAAFLALPALLALFAAAWHGAAHDLRRDGQSLEKLAADGAEESDGRFQKAYLEAIRRHPVDYLPRLTASKRALRQGNPHLALALAGQSMSLFPALDAPHRQAALALERMGAWPQAATEWKLAGERSARGDADAHRLALLFMRHRITPDRLDGLAPVQGPLSMELARQFIRLRAFGLAEAHLANVEKSAGTTADVLKLKLQTSRSAGRLEEALDTATRLSDLKGTEGDAGVQAMADLLRRMNRTDEAVALLRGRLDSSNTAPLRLQLCRLLLAQGRSQEAKDCLEKRPRVLTKAQRLEGLKLKAAIARRMSDWPGAVRALRTAVLLASRDARLRLELAQALSESGRMDEALSEIRRAEQLAMEAPKNAADEALLAKAAALKSKVEESLDQRRKDRLKAAHAPFLLER